MPKHLVLYDVVQNKRHEKGQPQARVGIVELPEGSITPVCRIDLDRDDAAAFLHLLEQHNAKPAPEAVKKNPMDKIKPVE